MGAEKSELRIIEEGGQFIAVRSEPQYRSTAPSRKELARKLLEDHNNGTLSWGDINLPLLLLED